MSLADVAREVGVSRYHFLRVFREETGETGETGETPHRYLTRRRMEHACAELRCGAVSVTEIALACGYRSTSQFSRAFLREIGVSPTTYRSAHR